MDDIDPVVSPGRADCGILLVPFGRKGIEGLLSHFNRGGAVDLLEVVPDLLRCSCLAGDVL